jgi:hypothetical protein
VSRILAKFVSAACLAALASITRAGEYCWNETVQFVILQGDEIYFTTNKTCPGWCRIDPSAGVEARRRAYAMLLTAKTMEKPLTFFWNEHATSCAGAVPVGSIPGTVLMP